LNQAIGSITLTLLALGAGFFTPEARAAGEYHEATAQGQIVAK
jgi:hypothetical protein